MTPSEFLEADIRLGHALQSGIAFEQAELGMEGLPPDWFRANPDLAKALKHIRVGVCKAMVEHSALVHLLIDKGVISKTEYFDAHTRGLAEEVASFERKLSDHLKASIKLV